MTNGTTDVEQIFDTWIPHKNNCRWDVTTIIYAKLFPALLCLIK
jgi:hypothetical protein